MSDVLLNEYCKFLVDYVICYGNRVFDADQKKRKMTEEESMSWLDSNCPAWRLAQPPHVGLIIVDLTNEHQSQDVEEDYISDVDRSPL